MPRLRTLIVAAGAAVAGAGWMTGSVAQADGYVYVPRSYYVAPPIYTPYYPVLTRAPIVVYEPAPPPPAPVAGTFYALPAQGPVRVRESWNSHPWRSRYRYEAKYPGGVEHKYRVKRDGNYVRFSEKWDD